MHLSLILRLVHNFVNILYYFLLRPPTILFYIYICIIKKYRERNIQNLPFIFSYIFKQFKRRDNTKYETEMISLVNASSFLYV